MHGIYMYIARSLIQNERAPHEDPGPMVCERQTAYCRDVRQSR